MDVNGTKYHLLYGKADWDKQLVEVDHHRETLAEIWETGTARHLDPALEWDTGSASLRLARKAPLFRTTRSAGPLDPALRRGAGRDIYGNWYWINPTEDGIRFLPNRATASKHFWGASDRASRCAPVPGGDFTPGQPALPAKLVLRGLAVTSHHFLVVGDVTEHGLLIFDLHSRGAPLLLLWPEDVPFIPWDLTATQDGGLLVLDKIHTQYWRLDADFRLLAEEQPGVEQDFQPGQPDSPHRVVRPLPHPYGYQLSFGSPPEAVFPLSIEEGFDGSVLILDTNPERDYSIIYEYHGAERLAAYPLKDIIEITHPRSEEGASELFSVVGYDFACLPGSAVQADNQSISPADCGCGESQPVTTEVAAASVENNTDAILYVAEQGGKQVMAFVIKREGGHLAGLEDKKDFLPMRRWGGKGLVKVGNQIFYDYSDRWVVLQEYVECYYSGRGVFVTPLTLWPGSPGGPFDSNEPGCTWHRLLLDAQIPADTRITIRARAADEPELLEKSAWWPQPNLYLRSDGAELPYYDPWADLRAAPEPFPERTGTWELLFQEIKGRYLQLEVTFEGSGRATPALRALRAWFPRFSYLDHYMPVIYREEPGPASFLERWLANFEGFYTKIEDQIEHVSVLFDPQTAPPQTLEWLACWLGLALDPLWPEERRRFFIRHADQLYRMRGTVAGVQIAVRLYLDQQLADTLFDPRCWSGGRVRLVEHFLKRNRSGLLFGDTSDSAGGDESAQTASNQTGYEDYAHRFSMLVPHNLSSTQLEMVDRIIRLEKPVHTSFELKRYWDMLRVGEARLGLDTELGESSAFIPMLLGEAYLSESYLEASYPFNLTDRLVLDRNAVGDMPAL